MNKYQKILDQHEKATEILDLIDYAHRCIKSRNTTLDIIRGNFTELENKLKHENEITELAIERLYKRYYKTINNGN